MLNKKYINKTFNQGASMKKNMVLSLAALMIGVPGLIFSQPQGKPDDLDGHFVDMSRHTVDVNQEIFFAQDEAEKKDFKKYCANDQATQWQQFMYTLGSVPHNIRGFFSVTKRKEKQMQPKRPKKSRHTRGYIVKADGSCEKKKSPSWLSFLRRK